MQHLCKLQQPPAEAILIESECLVTAATSAVYEGFDKHILMRICNDNDCILCLIQSPGTFILKGLPVIKVNKTLPAGIMKKIQKEVYLQSSESIKEIFFLAFGN